MTPICIPRTPVAKFGHQSQPELFDNVASSTEGQGDYTRAATYPNYGQAFADPRRVLLPLRSRTTTCAPYSITGHLPTRSRATQWTARSSMFRGN